MSGCAFYACSFAYRGRCTIAQLIASRIAVVIDAQPAAVEGTTLFALATRALIRELESSTPAFQYSPACVAMGYLYFVVAE